MDSLGEALAYDAMDHRAVNQQFVADLLAAGLEQLGAAGDEPVMLLDLGTGTAQIPIVLCERQPAVRVVAVDLAGSMLDLARGKIEIALLSDRIRLDRVDAKTLPYDDGQFDCVISNSLIHHLPEPAVALAEMLRVLRSDGLLFVRDLLRPVTGGQLDELVQTYAGDESREQQALLAASLHAALRVEELRALLAPLGVPVESVQPTSDRHWTCVHRKV